MAKKLLTSISIISRRNSFERIKTDRVFAPDTMLSQDAYTKYPSHVLLWQVMAMSFALTKNGKSIFRSV